MFDLVSNNYMLQMTDRSMTLAARRMSLIASNLANIDTPDYRTQDFSFEDAFQGEMAKLDRQFSPGSSPSSFQYFQDGGSGASAPQVSNPLDITYERNDGNDVHLDRETMNLAKTQEMYQLSSNFAQNELRTVLGAIRDAAK
jgi:flagellar basal-body rod protein FlgB